MNSALNQKSDIKNAVLGSLSPDEFSMITPRLEKITMPLGEYLYHPAERIQRIYFPETSVVSIVMVLENGETIESGIIGKEGFSGAGVLLSKELSPQEATIQLAGSGWYMTIDDFKKLFDENKAFRDAALGYLYTFVAQISQNAACLCHHAVNQRLARWLLLFADRAEGEHLVLTQEFIAQMLGVHRPTVSKSANELQKKGFISYNRGTVKILDRAGLEKFSCECYKTISQLIRGKVNTHLPGKSMTA
jgi:CRP-like cAMP-binding protein